MNGVRKLTFGIYLLSRTTWLTPVDSEPSAQRIVLIFSVLLCGLFIVTKPGKPKPNLRPIILLNTLRKVLSLITLDRIRPSIKKYLSHSQSGFRPEQSTSDVVWTHRWLAAKQLQKI